jgi:hypothetical protein
MNVSRTCSKNMLNYGIRTEPVEQQAQTMRPDD